MPPNSACLDVSRIVRSTVMVGLGQLESLRGLSLSFIFQTAPTLAGVSATERYAVSYCTMDGYGTRLIPPGTFESVHFV